VRRVVVRKAVARRGVRKARPAVKKAVVRRRVRKAVVRARVVAP